MSICNSLSNSYVLTMIQTIAICNMNRFLQYVQTGVCTYTVGSPQITILWTLQLLVCDGEHLSYTWWHIYLPRALQAVCKLLCCWFASNDYCCVVRMSWTLRYVLCFQCSLSAVKQGLHLQFARQADWSTLVSQEDQCSWTYDYIET